MGVSWQVLLVDALFLLLAGSGILWFKQWIKGQKQVLDQQLQALEEQQRQLAGLKNQLLAACAALGAERPDEVNPQLKAEREKEYEQARTLLVNGDDPGEVARRLGLGRAEVDVIKRVLQRRN